MIDYFLIPKFFFWVWTLVAVETGNFNFLRFGSSFSIHLLVGYINGLLFKHCSAFFKMNDYFNGLL